ncbi:MAG: TIGR04255 family protein [Myxococcota bacterium]|nr:TIGR04255 family protein [Myxococcota bacterium]
MAAPDTRSAYPQQLARKPLVEVIFELRWKLEAVADPTGGRDPGFKILLGRFFDRVRATYPAVIDLPATQIPEEMVPNVVRHQFRPDPNAWPLLQLGPGILTTNETTAYSWAAFKPKLVDAISALFASYPGDLHPFEPNQVVLRYLNAIPLDPKRTPTLRFLREQLHTEIAIAPSLAQTVHDLDQPWGMNLSLTLPMKTPKGACGLSFSTGRAGDKPALIWQLEAQARGGDVPRDEASLGQWLEDAHAVVERWFFTLSEGQLLDSFKG